MRVVEPVKFVREEDVAAHLARQRAVGFLHLHLDQAVAGLPHQRLAAVAFDMIEQRAAGLHIRNNRRACAALQQILRVDHQQLVAPDHAAFTVDRADPVSVTIESDAEIEILLGDHCAQIGQILLDRGIGMMIGEGTIDLRIQNVMFAGQLLDEFFERRASSAI